jgi:hypothetical protein
MVHRLGAPEIVHVQPFDAKLFAQLIFSSFVFGTPASYAKVYSNQTAHATTARIPSWFEFIRRPRLLGRPCQAGFAGVGFRHEKPLRFRAGPAGAAQAFMDCGDMSPLSKRRHGVEPENRNTNRGFHGFHG